MISHDHKALEQIISKPLLSAPMRIQKMMLKLQWCNIDLPLLEEKEMHASDASDTVQHLRNIKINKTNSSNLYPPTKGYLRETCKSQNINLIYQKFTWVSFRSDQTPVKYVLVLGLIKEI